MVKIRLFLWTLLLIVEYISRGQCVLPDPTLPDVTPDVTPDETTAAETTELTTSTMSETTTSDAPETTAAEATESTTTTTTESTTTTTTESTTTTTTESTTTTTTELTFDFFTQSMDFDECESSPCLNEGTCFSYDSSQAPPNQIGQIICQCADGYEDPRCGTESQYVRVWLIVAVTNDWDPKFETLPSLPGKEGIKQERMLCSGGDCTTQVKAIGLSPHNSVNLHYDFEFFTPNISVVTMRNRTDSLEMDIRNNQLDAYGVIPSSFSARYGTGTGILKIRPNFGPISGGTKVTIVGYDLKPEFSVLVDFGGLECNVATQTKQFIVCSTTPAQESVIGTAMGTRMSSFFLQPSRRRLLQLQIPSSVYYYDPQGFTYTPDPTITSVDPLNVLVSGGNTLTVNGTNLDSIQNPVMFIYLVYDGGSENYSTDCTVISSFQMTCVTPNIDLPTQLLQNPATRRKRWATGNVQEQPAASMDNRNDFYMQNEKVDNNNNKNEDIYSKGNTGKALEHKKRAKRQSSELSKTVNTVYDASFFLGFQLDAVDTYRNLSESLPEYSRLTVHFSPEFYRFEEEGHVRIFKTYSPHNDEILTIKGKKIVSSGAVTYTVSIGTGICSNIQVYENRLLCRPPVTEPAPNHYDNGKIVVRVELSTIYRFDIGTLVYRASLLEDGTVVTSIAVGCGLGGLLLIVIIIVLSYKFCYCCRRRVKKRKRGRPPPSRQSLGKRISNLFRAASGPYARKFKENPTLSSFPRESARRRNNRYAHPNDDDFSWIEDYPMNDIPHGHHGHHGGGRGGRQNPKRMVTGRFDHHREGRNTLNADQYSDDTSDDQGHQHHRGLPRNYGGYNHGYRDDVHYKDPSRVLRVSEDMSHPGGDYVDDRATESPYWRPANLPSPPTYDESRPYHRHNPENGYPRQGYRNWDQPL